MTEHVALSVRSSQFALSICKLCSAPVRVLRLQAPRVQLQFGSALHYNVTVADAADSEAKAAIALALPNFPPWFPKVDRQSTTGTTRDGQSAGRRASGCG